MQVYNREIEKMALMAVVSGMNNATPFADIGERLSAVRLAFGGNQSAWALAHGFNVTQYNHWERGIRRIPIEHAELLCERYGLTLDFVYRNRVDGLSETLRQSLSLARAR